MMWTGEYSREWGRRFALFPASVENSTKVVWLQYYWKKYVEGDQLCTRCQLSQTSHVSGHWITSATDPTKSNS